MSSPPSEIPATSAKLLRVLFVEDCPADVELCLWELKKAGFEVHADVTETAEEFAERLRSKPYDIVLADYSLPNWTGIGALEHLQRYEKEMPFILVTGSLGEETAVECIKKGATDYVLKDRLARLPVAVHRALEEKSLREGRKRAEGWLRHLASIVESSGDAIISNTLEGVIVSWNKGAQKIYGYTAEEVKGRSISILIPSDRAHEVAQILERVKRGERIELYETAHVRKDGTPIHVLLTISPIIDAAGKLRGISTIARDITERKQLEMQLQGAQKMEAIGRLAGGLAHDFNNLLGVIIGYSELLQDRFDPTDPMRRNAEQIKKAADRAVTLTRQLLAFSRKQVLQPRVLDLNAIMADMSKMLPRLIGEDISLVAILDPALARVKADPGQIEQVIMNLVVNARDAMPQGGKLIIETANAELDEAYARRHAGAKPGRFVILAVSDTGIGMDAETQSHIFEPFFTTKGPDKGTGLGLATVYGIVKQSGGYISLYSEPGQGTTFKIYLPRVEEAAEVTGRTKASGELPRGRETILLAEDEEPFRKLTRESLESSGYTVLEAGSGVEAIQAAERYKGPVHLLLTDVVMPGMSGRELAERLTSSHPELKVLYMSGYTDDAIVHHAVLDPGTSFLSKPFTRDALARKVREVLGWEKAE